MNFRHGISQILTALSQNFNLCCNPFSEETLAYETFSGRCGRLGDQKPYMFWKCVIDAVFLPLDGPEHCINQHKKERARYAPQPPTSPP